MTQTNFESFQRSCQKQQRDYIERDRSRYEAAMILRLEYERTMQGLGLRPLDRLEIADRLKQLDRMEAAIPQDYGDTPAMRATYAAYIKRPS